MSTTVTPEMIAKKVAELGPVPPRTADRIVNYFVRGIRATREQTLSAA